MCVRNADDHCVLQFTLIHAAGCVLHRRTSRVIHRQELSTRFVSASSLLPGSGGDVSPSFVRSRLKKRVSPRPVVSGAEIWVASRGRRGEENRTAARPRREQRPGGGRLPLDSASPRGRIEGQAPASRGPGQDWADCSVPRAGPRPPDPAAEQGLEGARPHGRAAVSTPGVGPLPRTHPETSQVGHPGRPVTALVRAVVSDRRGTGYISGGPWRAGSPGWQTSPGSPLSLGYR